MRITVNDVLGWLSHGMTEEEILDEHPGLQKEDFAAVYAFAAEIARKMEFAAVVSADQDFVHLAERLGPPPKVMRIECCDFPAKDAA